MSIQTLVYCTPVYCVDVISPTVAASHGIIRCDEQAQAETRLSLFLEAYIYICVCVCINSCHVIAVLCGNADALRVNTARAAARRGVYYACPSPLIRLRTYVTYLPRLSG